MRPSRAIAFALVTLVSSSLAAQTAASQPAPPQTARQALIEMFFGQAPDHLEKHLPDITRRTYQRLGGANGQSGLDMFSLLAMQAKSGKNNLETFDTGSTLATVKELPGGSYERMDITVERDDFAGDKDEIELVPHMISDGKEETLPFILHFTFAMKMESSIWRLNDVSIALQVPLADPAFLKSMEERQLHQNEQAALWSIRAVISAEKSYQSAQGGFACTLSALGSAGKEAGAARRAYLYDSQVAGGKKNGYTFAISECDASHYHAVAEPVLPESGQHAYCADESGMVRSSADGKASTCLATGEVVEQKVPAARIPQHSAPAQSDAASGTTEPAQRVSISQGVSAGLLISRVPPIYPPLARNARIQGSVVMKALINQTGDVVSLELISGHPMLAPAALDAVRQWKYRPYMLNGNAVEVETQVIVNFTLSEP
jgi:TonB family protein